MKRLLQITTIFLFWLMALTAWWSILWHLDAFARFGGDLPSLTLLVRISAEIGLPFWIAAVFSGVAVYETFRPGNRAVPWSVWLLCIASVLLLIVIVAITLPVVMCGNFLPGQGGIF